MSESDWVFETLILSLKHRERSKQLGTGNNRVNWKSQKKTSRRIHVDKRTKVYIVHTYMHWKGCWMKELHCFVVFFVDLFEYFQARPWEFACWIWSWRKLYIAIVCLCKFATLFYWNTVYTIKENQQSTSTTRQTNEISVFDPKQKTTVTNKKTHIFINKYKLIVT